MEPVQPVIVLGMHRSGTGLMTQIVERSGIYMGDHKEINHEAMFFLKLNEWLLRQLGATWDEPRNAEFQDDWVSEYLAKALEIKLSSDARIEYLGKANFNRYSSIANLDFSWGWKDPRNVWTAEIWLKLFPGAKIINVYRHPVDVAASLRYREQQHAIAAKKAADEIGIARFLENNYRFQISGRVKILREGFGLWEQYVTKALSLAEKYPDNVLTIAYEELLADPERVLVDINAHLGVKEAMQNNNGLAGLIKAKRGLAFRENPELLEFHRSISGNPLVVKLGYN